MKTKDYYTPSEFIKRGHITKKTLRYYNEHHILDATYINEKGVHFYTDDDLAHLQQILFLKYLGFSLNDIKQMTIYGNDKAFISKSIKMQTYFINEKIEQLKLIKEALLEASITIDKKEDIDWEKMIETINDKEYEDIIKKQYENSTNIESRINLHNKCSINKENWFVWLYKNLNLKENQKVLEIGSGNAALWKENLNLLPNNIEITLSDISLGMLKNAKDNLKNDKHFSYKIIDGNNINLKDEKYDLIIANHVLFYLKDIDKSLKDIKTLLKPNGTFICSTYSKMHMKEINDLVKEFDSRIELSKDKLYEIFGKENGQDILEKRFNDVKWIGYEDGLLVNDENILIQYILSCHGNQNKYIVDKFKEFKTLVTNKCKNTFYIHKDAGIFIAR